VSEHAADNFLFDAGHLGIDRSDLRRSGWSAGWREQ
jgi:hypothetical protein